MAKFAEGTHTTPDERLLQSIPKLSKTWFMFISFPN